MKDSACIKSDKLKFQDLFEISVCSLSWTKTIPLVLELFFFRRSFDR